MEEDESRPLLKKMTNREKAFRLVERELRKLNIREVTLWGAVFWRTDGEPVDVTVKQRGSTDDAGGVGLLAAVEAERKRRRKG